nr:MAG TPA: hypothetical protein [Caudoviricetes sp.]
MLEKNRIFENVETKVQCRIVDEMFLDYNPLGAYTEVRFKEISDKIPDGKLPIIKMPLSEFLQKYRPISLYVGDDVVKVCMGKFLKIFKVSKVENLRAFYQDSTLETSSIISYDLSIKKFISDEETSYPCEYKYLSEAMKNRMENIRKNSELIKDLRDIIDIVSNSRESVDFSSYLHIVNQIKRRINIIAYNGN